LDTNPTPSLSGDFGPSQRLALALTGTVALPSPVPATARVFIGISPHHDAALPMASPRFFLKSVQTVSAKQVVTRIFDLAELRAVDLPAIPREDYVYPMRETHLIEGAIADEIKRAQDLLRGAEAAQPKVYEVLLYDDAVLYVREEAPVLMHVVYEYGVPAAESTVEVATLRCC
jgi:hypothetical protein